MTTTTLKVSKISNNESFKITRVIPSNTSEKSYVYSMLNLISLYTNEDYSLSNIGQVNENQEISYFYGINPNTVTVNISFNLLPPYTGTYIESGFISSNGIISFVGNIGTFSDSDGNNLRIIVYSDKFTFENLNWGLIYDSLTGVISPI